MSDEPAPFPLDHNQSYRAKALETVRFELKLFRERRDEIVATANKVEKLRDRIDVAKATDIVGIAQTIGEMVEQERKKVSGPLYEASRAVNEEVAEFWRPVIEATTRLTDLITEYASEEDKRIKDQQREQAAHEARRLAQAAPAPPPPPAAPAPRPAARRRVRSDYGFSATTGEVDIIEIEDVRALPDWIFESERVREAIIQTAKPMVANKITIPGLKVTKGLRTNVRR